MENNNKPNNLLVDLNKLSQKTEDTKKEYTGINPEQFKTTDWRSETQGLTSITGTHNIDRSDYDKHLDYVYANRDIDRQRAEAQGFGREMASAIGQLPFRIVGDVISMVGIVPEALDGDLWQVMSGNAEVDFGNSLLDLGMGISDWAQEAMPIYKMNPGGTIGDQFSGGWDSAYWAAILPEAVSTVADLFVSKGALSLTKSLARQGTKKITKGLATKQLKAVRKNLAADINQKMAMPGMNQAAKETLEQSSKYTEDILSRTLRNESFKNGRDNLFAAYIGRHFEASLEAAQLQEESKFLVEETDIKDLASQPAYKDFIKENGRPPSKQEYAEYIGTEAGKRAYKLNMANMLWDFAQLSSMSKFMGKGNTLKVRTKSAEMLGQKLTKGQRLRYRATPFLRTGASGVTEAIEEGWNFMATEEGRHLFKDMTDEDYESAFRDRARQYLKNDHFWESAFMGFVGSTIMTPILGRKAYLQDTTDRLESLNRRKQLLATYGVKMTEIDSDNSLNDSAKTTMKRMLTRSFVSGVAIDAAANGNSRETMGFFASPDYKKDLIENKGFTEQEATDHISDIVDTIKHAEEIFQDAKKFDFLGKAFRGKNKDAKVQNEVINKILLEKMTEFNTNKSYEEYKGKVSEHIKKAYGDKGILLEDELAAEVRALTNLNSKYLARAASLSGRIAELQNKKKKKKKLKSQEAQELLDLERLNADYIELAEKFFERAEQFNKTLTIAEGMKTDAGQSISRETRRSALKDEQLIELIEHREQYRTNSEFLNEKSSSQEKVLEQAREDLKLKEQKYKEKRDGIIADINLINDPKNLDAFLNHSDPKVLEAAKKRKDFLIDKNKTVNNSNNEDLAIDSLVEDQSQEEGEQTPNVPPKENKNTEDLAIDQMVEEQPEEDGETTATPTQEPKKDLAIDEMVEEQPEEGSTPTSSTPKQTSTPTKQPTKETDFDKEINRISKLPFKERIPALMKAGVIASDSTHNMGNRFPVIMNIGGVKVAFYRSSTGTSGKIKGNWYPFFGYGKYKNGDSWLIKGSLKDMENHYDSPAIKKYSEILNKTLNWNHDLDSVYGKNKVENHPFFNVLNLVSEGEFNKELYGEEDLNIIKEVSDLSSFILPKLEEINKNYNQETPTKENKVKPNAKQKEVADKLIERSNNVRKVAITFKTNAKGQPIDNNGNLVPENEEKVIVSARVLTQEEHDNGTEYQGYIVLDDNDFDVFSDVKITNSESPIMKGLLERATFYIDKKIFGTDNQYRGEGKFKNRGIFGFENKPAGKIGTRIDDLGREVLDFFTENDISEKTKLAAKKAMVAKYAVRGDKEMFSTEENVSQSIMNQTVNHLVDRFADFFEQMRKEDKYIVPAEIQVATANYAGTTDITVIDKLGNVEIYDMKTFRNTNKNTGSNLGQKRIEDYSNQLYAYANAIEGTGLTVSKLGLVGIGVDWKNATSESDIKNKGLLSVPTRAEDYKKDTSLTNLSEESTKDILFINRNSTNNSPDPDKKRNKPGQEKAIEEKGTFKLDNSFWGAIFMREKNPLSFEQKTAIIDEHYEAIVSLEEILNPDKELTREEQEKALRKKISVRYETSRWDGGLIYKVFVGEHNIGGIGEKTPNVGREVKAVKGNKEKTEQLKRDLKNSIVNSMLDRKVSVTHIDKNYRSLKEAFNVLFKNHLDQNEKINLTDKEIDNFFATITITDAHSFNKDMANKYPFFTGEWITEADDSTGSGAQAIFSLGPQLNSSFASIKYSEEGKGKLADLIQSKINKELERDNFDPTESAEYLNNYIKNIFGPREEQVRKYKFTVDNNRLAFGLETNGNVSNYAVNVEGELNIADFLKEDFKDKNFEVKPIVIMDFGVKEGKATQVDDIMEIKKILLAHGETNMSDPFAPFKNITLSSSKKEDYKPAPKTEQNENIAPKKDVKQTAKPQEKKKPDQTTSTRKDKTKTNTQTNNNLGLKFDFDASLVTNEDYDLENFESFRKWFEQNLPNIPIEVVENIISRTGVRAFGTFYQNAITLAKNAPLGTGYHEAYHFVHNSLLTGAERIEMIREAKKVYPAPNGQDLQTLRDKYPGLPEDSIIDIYYEEQLAEAFRKYKVTKDSDDAKTSTLKRLFDKILDFLKSFVNARDNYKIQRMFKKIDSGHFKNSTIGSNSLMVALDKPLESFKERRLQEQFADSVVNYVYSNYKLFAKKENAESAKEFLSQDEDYKEIVKDYEVDDPVDATKLVLFNVIHNNSVSVTDEERDVITDMLMNDFEDFFNIIENKLYNFYGMEYTKASIKEIDNQDVAIENNDEDLVQKDWADETSLKEKPSKSMSKTLKRIMRNSLSMKATMVEIDGKVYYIADLVDDIINGASNRKFEKMADLKKYILENNTKRTLGLANYVNFTRLNKYLERRLANITTKDNMLAALKESSKLFPDAAALYFELKNSDNTEVWFEHFRKNAYTMVSSQRKDSNQSTSQATYVANRESGFLEVSKQANRILYSNFNTIQDFVLKNIYDGKKLLKKGDSLNENLLDMLVKMGFDKTKYSDDNNDQNFFRVALGDTELSLPLAKKRFVFDIAKKIAEEISVSNRETNNVNGYLDNIAETVKDYQWITNSNFRVDNKGLYGIAKGNMLTEKIDDMNNLYDSNTNIQEAAIKLLEEMIVDPHINHSNWNNKFFKIIKGKNNKVQPMDGGFMGILYGVYNTFNGVEYSNWTENDTDHMHFAEFLGAYKRGGNQLFYNQLLPTQSDSTTPYFIGVPVFKGNEISRALGNILTQEIERIKKVVKGLNDGTMHQGNLPKNSISIVDVSEKSKNPYKNQGAIIDPLNSKILKINFLPYFDSKLFNVHYAKGKYVIDLEETDDISDILRDYESQLKKKFAQEFDESPHLTEGSAFNDAYKGQVDVKKEWINFQLNYIINANEMQNFFTGHEYEFKGREDKSKRGKNPSANGVVSTPSNGLKVKKRDKNGKVYYEEKKDSMGNVVKDTVDMITLTDIEGYTPIEVVTDIFNKTRELFDLEQAKRAIEGHGWKYDGNQIIQGENYDKGDAGSYMTWQRFEQLQRNRGKVHSGSKLDKLFNKLRDGKALDEKDYQELSGIIAVEKPYYGDRKINPETGLMESHMVKFGITVLFPDLVRGTKLEQIAEYMETEGIAEAHFGSAQKIGQTMSLDLNEFHQNDGINLKEFIDNKKAEAIRDIQKSNRNATNQIPDGYNPFITKLDLTKYRIQLENPDHTVDTDNLLGTQFAKLIFSNISSEAVYKVYNPETKEYEQKTGQEVVDYYAVNYATDVSQAMEELLDEIGGKIEIVDKETGDYRIKVKDPKKLAKILSKELDKKDEMPDGVKEFLELDQNGEFVIPLNYSPRKNDFQSIILSMFTKRVNKLRMPGYSGAQVSSVFFENINSKEQNGIEWLNEKRKSKVLLGERIDPETGEILPVEILVKRTQSWMNGKTIEEISKIPGALESIGYRIPTEGKSSMIRVKIVGFLPDSTKATVVVPDSLVPKMGSDFDIDKLFFMQRKYGKNKDGKVFRHTLEKGRDAQSRSYGRKNNMYDAFDSILSSQAHFAELMSPQGFEDLKKAAKNTVGEQDNNDDLNHNLYKANKEFRKRNMDGKQTLGIAASANPTNSLFQILDTTIKNKEGKVDPIEIVDASGQKRLLSKISNYDQYKNYNGGSYITMQSAQGVGASADAAKEPTTTFIGLNPGNFATYQAMIMLGIPIMESYFLTRQPIFDYYGRVKGSDDVYFSTAMGSLNNDSKLFSALLDAKLVKFANNKEKKKEIERLVAISKNPNESYKTINLEVLKKMPYDIKKVDLDTQAKLLGQIKKLEKIGNQISNFTSSTKPEGFGTGKDSFATALKIFDIFESRKKSSFKSSYDKMYPNTNSTSIVAAKNIKHSNLTDVEIFDYFYKINQDNITEKDC